MSLKQYCTVLLFLSLGVCWSIVAAPPTARPMAPPHAISSDVATPTWLHEEQNVASVDISARSSIAEAGLARHRQQLHSQPSSPQLSMGSYDDEDGNDDDKEEPEETYENVPVDPSFDDRTIAQDRLLEGLTLASPTPPISPLPQGDFTPFHVGNIDFPLPSFARLVPDETKRRDASSSVTDMYVSSFTGSPFGHDVVYYVPDVVTAASWLPSPDFPTPPYQTIPGSLVWPNEVTAAPSSLFSGAAGVVVAGGFLVPGKTSGGIWFSEQSQGAAGKWIQLFAGKDYFYHRVVFYDVNKDGKLDMLTCRSEKPLFGDGRGDLTWLEPIDRSNPMGRWKEHVLGPHCDVFFTVADLDGDGQDEIVTAEFWGKSLTLIQTKDEHGSFADPDKLVYIAIDSHIGRVFDVQIVDLNNDGKPELLVSTHQGAKDQPSGAVYAYEVPRDLSPSTGYAWIRHTLALDFPVLLSGIGQAAPGAAQAFYPDLSRAASTKPTILVAGDAAKSAFILTPASGDPRDWNYILSIFHTCDSTVGGIAIGDANGDGFSEVFIPCYEKNYVAVYSYGPNRE